MRLLIARHGNTFEPDQTPVRIGAKTDLPLTQQGYRQAEALGQSIRARYGNLSAIYTGRLKRAYETGAQVLAALPPQDPPLSIQIMDTLNEIDYGPDEGKTDAAVIARMGQHHLAQWDEQGIIPPGWLADAHQIQQQWQAFADTLLTTFPATAVILCVTSNGIARFSPQLIGNFSQFCKQHTIKMATGAISSFCYRQGQWQLEYWNNQP